MEREREREFDEEERRRKTNARQGEKRLERDRFEEVNEEDRDSRWSCRWRVWWIMARTAKATVMVALGTLASKDRI